MSGRIGVRGALVLLGALPGLVATLAVGWLAVLTHRDAVASLDVADAARRFEVFSQAVSEFEGELALMDAWSRSSEFQAEDTADLIGLWFLTTADATDARRASITDAGLGLDGAVVARLIAVHDRLVSYRSAVAAGDPDEIAETIDATRDDLRRLADEVGQVAVDEVGDVGPVLVELLDLQTALSDEAVLLSEVLVSGVGPTSDRGVLLVARTRSDESLERVERGLGEDEQARRSAFLDSTQRTAWEELRRSALSSTPQVAARREPVELLGVIQEGTDFVRLAYDFSDGLFDSVVVAASEDGQDAERRRDVIIGGGALLVALATVGALLIGRALARRIRAVAHVATRVSAGDLAVDQLELSGRDEVASLAGAVDEMVLTLRRANAQLDALAAGRTDDPALDEELPGSIGRSLRTAIRRLGRSTEELKRQATHDALTGLLDRYGLDELVATWDARRRAPIGVIVIDLDGFKDVNDEHGHNVGDEVLRAVATRLGSLARSSDVVARVGGDEFVVLLAPGVDAEITEQVSDRLVELICQPVTVDGVSMRVGASVGWVLAEPDLPTPEALVRADAAMYEAKRAGKGRAVRAVRGDRV